MKDDWGPAVFYCHDLARRSQVPVYIGLTVSTDDSLYPRNFHIGSDGLLVPWSGNLSSDGKICMWTEEERLERMEIDVGVSCRISTYLFQSFQPAIDVFIHAMYIGWLHDPWGHQLRCLYLQELWIWSCRKDASSIRYRTTDFSPVYMHVLGNNCRARELENKLPYHATSES